jgi:hypothetical protein
MNATHKSISCLRFFKRLAGLACILALCMPAMAGQQTTRGLDFWLAFIMNAGGDASVVTVYVSSDTNANFTVSVPGLGFSQSSNVTAGTITSIIVPIDAMLSTSDGIEDRGIQVTSDQPISVYGLNQYPESTDASFILPTASLGQEYMVMSYESIHAEIAGFGSEFGVVAVADTTTVTVTPSVTVGSRVAGTPYMFVLNQGETYQLRSSLTGPEGDLTGTIVESDKPVAVFGGVGAANVPTNSEAADHCFDQMPPVSAWGQRHFTVPLGGRANGDTFRYLACQDNTSVFVDDVLVATLDSGEFLEQLLTSNSTVNADKPILVMQYANGKSFDNITGDPFMMMIPPFEQFLSNYIMATPASGFATNFVSIVAPSSAVSQLTIDGVPLDPALFTQIGTSTFMGCSVLIAPGSHHFQAPQPFGVFMYGFNSYDSYGYAGGMSLSPVATVQSLEMTPETATRNTGQSVTLNARLLDQYTDPVAGVRVDFAVTGSNPSTGTGITDANGYASYTYTGMTGGQDTVVASVGNLTDQSVIAWTVAGTIINATKWMDMKVIQWRLDPNTGALMADFRLKFLPNKNPTDKTMPELRKPFRLALANKATWSLQKKDGKINGIPYTDVTTQMESKLKAKYGRKVMQPGDSVVVTVGIFSRDRVIPAISGYCSFWADASAMH